MISQAIRAQRPPRSSARTIKQFAMEPGSDEHALLMRNGSEFLRWYCHFDDPRSEAGTSKLASARRRRSPFLNEPHPS